MTHLLHIREWGPAGPPVVLLHGLGASASFWRPVAESVRTDLRVVAPDLLGFGRSPWPRDARYTPREHLDSLERSLEKSIAGQAVVLGGHSLGAILALAWAARRPRMFTSLVLTGLPVFRSAAVARSHIVSLSPLARIAIGHPRLGAALTAVMCRTRPFWQGVAPLLGGGFPADVARDWVLHDWRSYGGTLERCIFGVRLDRMADRVGGQGISVRVLHGDADREAPIGAVRMLTQRLGWHLTVIEGGGHFLPITHPAACAELFRVAAPIRDASLSRHDPDGAGQPAALLSPRVSAVSPGPTRQLGAPRVDLERSLRTSRSGARSADGRHTGRQPQEAKAN